jgi:hypothetical protein
MGVDFADRSRLRAAWSLDRLSFLLGGFLVENRMMELGIDPLKIRVGEPEHGIRHAAFIPHKVDRGGNTPDRKLNLFPPDVPSPQG